MVLNGLEIEREIALRLCWRRAGQPWAYLACMEGP